MTDERQWGVWLVTEEDVDELVRRAELGGKEEKQIVALAEMTISKLPIGCILCGDRTNGSDAAKIGIVKPMGVVLTREDFPGFVVCQECAHGREVEAVLRIKVRERFGIDAQPVAANKVLQ